MLQQILIESQLLPWRVEVEGCLGCLEHSKWIPVPSYLSPSAHELSLSSSKVLSSIKRSGESSCSRTGVRGLGVDNLEEGQLDFYNTHRRVTFGRNRRSPNPSTWPNTRLMVIGFQDCLRCSPARRSRSFAGWNIHGYPIPCTWRGLGSSYGPWVLLDMWTNLKTSKYDLLYDYVWMHMRIAGCRRPRKILNYCFRCVLGRLTRRRNPTWSGASSGSDRLASSLHVTRGVNIPVPGY